MSKPVPPHGTTARYQGTRRTGNRPPCHCRKCVDAHTKACARRQVARLAGIDLRVPSAPVTAHIRALLDADPDTTCPSIAAAAGLSVSTVKHAARGLTRTVNRTTAQKILAVSAVRPAAPNARIDPTGTARRIRALYARGHGPTAISAAIGRSKTAVKDIASGAAATVSAATFRAVADAYPALAAREGTSIPARRWAAAHGWQDPLFWEDYDRIDDPAFDPEAVGRVLKRDELAALRRADITHLADYGYTPEAIHQRLTAAGHDLVIGTVQAVVREHRTGVRRARGKAAA